MILIVLVAEFGDSKTFRCDYTYYNVIGGWMKIHIIPETWREARLSSHLEGANLAFPLNKFFGGVMMSMMIQTEQLKYGVFTGIHSTFSKGDYHSIQNIPLSKIPHRWAKVEPNNLNNNEECIIMWPNGEILDQSCTETYIFFYTKYYFRQLHSISLFGNKPFLNMEKVKPWIKRDIRSSQAVNPITPPQESIVAPYIEMASIMTYGVRTATRLFAR